MRFRKRLILFVAFLPLLANAQTSTKGIQFNTQSSIPCPALTSCMWVDTANKQVNFFDGTTAKSVPSIVASTKGDLAAYTGTVWAKLADGTDGQCLLAQSSQTTGLQWGSCGTSGSGVANAIATWSGTNTLTGSPNFTFNADGANSILLGSATTPRIFPIISMAQQVPNTGVGTSGITFFGAVGADAGNGHDALPGGFADVISGTGGAGAVGFTAGNGASVVLLGGIAGAANGGSVAATSGGVFIDSGSATFNSPTTSGSISIGVTSASSTLIGRTGKPVIFPGATIGPVSGQQHTIPAVASDTFALLAAVQTLTNTTLQKAGSANQVAFWNASNNLTGSSTFTYDGLSTIGFAPNSNGNITFTPTNANAALVINATQRTSGLSSTILVAAGKGFNATGGINAAIGGVISINAGDGGDGIAGQTAGSGATLSLLGGKAGSAGGGTAAALSGGVTIDAGPINGATAAGTINIGSNNSTAINMGHSGMVYTLIGTSISTPALTSTGLVVNGVTTLGATSANLVNIVGSLAGGFNFSQGTAPTVGMTVRTNGDTNALAMTYIAQQGGPASATGGGTGGVLNVIAGTGGLGTLALNPGTGGQLFLQSGDGGTAGSGNSGSGQVLLDTGAIHGTGTPGTMIIGTSHAGTITIGRSTQVVNIAGGHVLNYLSTAAGATLTVGQNIVGVTSTASARAYTLPAQTAGLAIVVKDESGAAATNNITVTPASGTIDGAANKVINTNFGVLRLYSNATNWFTW